ncbi:hypothetical protein KGF54_005181 [Candida jiufengensis]|uniref:uncharacterized protein n=1 Tax=Candida jiufengensis TaxID=497108 RepID=UPI002224215D|nr:uncharacterized protein KGF54_005181 [Candida jiufengensis]KAI5950364.1 hypothetical protein KGF54_005181 [Candida jiufengensis]
MYITGHSKRFLWKVMDLNSIEQFWYLINTRVQKGELENSALSQKVREAGDEIPLEQILNAIHHQINHSTSSLSLNDNNSNLIENANTTVFNTTIQTNPINDIGFSNLNKINTNTSQLSNIRASTTKSKGLSKLFSRKRSLTNISDKSYLGANYIDVDSLFCFSVLVLNSLDVL